MNLYYSLGCIVDYLHDLSVGDLYDPSVDDRSVDALYDLSVDDLSEVWNNLMGMHEIEYTLSPAPKQKTKQKLYQTRLTSS